MNPVAAEFSARNASGIQDTAYVLRLLDSGLDYSTEEVRGLSTSSLILDRPSLAQSQFSPLAGSSSIGSIGLALLDQAGAITAARRATQIRGQEAEVWEGYRGLGWGAWTQVLKGKVRRFERASSGVAWSLEVADRWADADIERFAPADLAAEPWSGGDKSFDGGSLVLRDADDDSLYDTFILYGNPVTLGLKMLLSDGALDGSQGGYNVWPSWAGAGLTSDEVDVAWWEAERAKISVVEMRFTLRDAENVRDFIVEDIARALGGYTMLSGAGKLRIHYPSQPASTSDLQSVSDANIISIPSFADVFDLYLSHVQFELDHDGEQFLTKLPPRASHQYLDGDHDEERLHPLKSRGLQSALGGISIADTVTEALFRRYADPPPRSRFSAFYSAHLVESGDVLRCTSTKWPDVDGRGVGAERLLEVLQVRPQINRTEFDVVELTGPLTGPRVAVIAPNSVASTYGAATAADRAYAYIASDATETFANGDSAFSWA